ncbi:TPA: hypothetical protein ACSP84_004020 [Aeromonas veronii]
MSGIVLCLSMVTEFAYSQDGHISIIDYQEETQLLSLNIVSPVTGEDKIFLSADGITSELRRFTRVGDYRMVIYLPCGELKDGDYLLYRTSDVALPLSLKHISCTSDNEKLQQPRIIYSNTECIIEPKGTTLWRVGSLMAQKNGYSVYQNMFAVFLTNRNNFIDADITKMRDNLLLCPTEDLLASIDKHHAIEMFQDAEAFRLDSIMQKATQPGNKLDRLFEEDKVE